MPLFTPDEPLDEQPCSPGAAIAPTAAAASGSRGVSTWVVLVLLGIIAILLFRYRTAIWFDLRDPQATSRAVTPRGELSSMELSQVAIFEQAAPSVVHITAIQARGARGQLRRPDSVESGTGTDFIWERNDDIVPN